MAIMSELSAAARRAALDLWDWLSAELAGWSQSQPLLPWLLAAALALALGAALWARRRERGRIGRANQKRQRRAQRAESEAERWLEEQGFLILERQASQVWTLEVDGEPREVLSRADLLLERDGRLWVADVKTGGSAPDPALPATRRQLLEYLLAFGADTALVVDMERRELHQVDFSELLGAPFDPSA